MMPVSIMFIPDACFPLTLDLDAGVYDAYIFDPCPCCMQDECVCVCVMHISKIYDPDYDGYIYSS